MGFRPPGLDVRHRHAKYTLLHLGAWWGSSHSFLVIFKVLPVLAQSLDIFLDKRLGGRSSYGRVARPLGG